MNNANQTKRNNNFAFAGYIIGLVGLLSCWIPIAGIILCLVSGGFLTVAWILRKGRRQGFLLVGTVAVAIALVLSLVSTGKAFINVWGDMTAPMSAKTAYEEICHEADFASYSDNTGGLTVDTNPTDTPDGEQTEAYEIIRLLNEEYEVPQEARDQMKAATKDGGWQSYENKHVIVMWNYLPSRGLEIVYYSK